MELPWFLKSIKLQVEAITESLGGIKMDKSNQS